MFKNFTDNLGTWIGTILGGIVTITVAVIGSRKSKRSTKVEEVEGEAKEFELKRTKEQYYIEKIDATLLKFDVLSEKFEVVTGKLREMQTLHDESLVIIEELKAELNMYKTTKISP